MDDIRYEIECIVNILKSEREMFNSLARKAPQGGLILAKRGNRQFYMHSIPVETDQGGRRYKKSVIEHGNGLIESLAQKEYSRLALRSLDHNIRVLENAKAGLRDMSFAKIRADMRKPYQKLSDECIVSGIRGFGSAGEFREWARQDYEQSDYRVSEKIHTTSRGLKVRSRAELLIAEMLYKYNIPFRYEQVIHIGNYDLSPDFTFPDKDCREFYWEYCGQMGDPVYAEKQIWKRKLYESIGITAWSNMIYTFDDNEGIDMREIEGVIHTKILPRMGIPME